MPSPAPRAIIEQRGRERAAAACAARRQRAMEALRVDVADDLIEIDPEPPVNNAFCDGLNITDIEDTSTPIATFADFGVGEKPKRTTRKKKATPPWTYSRWTLSHEDKAALDAYMNKDASKLCEGLKMLIRQDMAGIMNDFGSERMDQLPAYIAYSLYEMPPACVGSYRKYDTWLTVKDLSPAQKLP